MNGHMEKRARKLFVIITIVTLSIACDQVSKSIVRHKVEYNSQITVAGKYLTLTKVENTGAFLSLGNTIPRPLYKLFMILLPLAILGYALFYLIKKDDITKMQTVAISLIVGGGIGNVFDRIVYGSVTDFLYFDFVLFHTGIVNIADISVTAGFFIIIYDLIFKQKP